VGTRELGKQLLTDDERYFDINKTWLPNGANGADGCSPKSQLPAPNLDSFFLQFVVVLYCAYFATENIKSRLNSSEFEKSIGNATSSVFCY